MTTLVLLLVAHCLCCAVIVYSFLLYPLLVKLLSRTTKPLVKPDKEDYPPVTLIIPFHNGTPFIERKIANALAIDYPRDRLDICAVDDGSTDGSTALLRSLPGSERITILQTVGHGGKNAALNQAIAATHGEIVVISDVDAMLAPDALLQMVPWFSNPSIGGVCGQKVIENAAGALAGEQACYIAHQQRIKLGESRLHSITTNEGKLHAVRRTCFQSLIDGVTDDLFNLLSVVGSGLRFIYEPSAIVRIPVPATSPAHELRRRRRIVHRSLRCMHLHGQSKHATHRGLIRWMLLTQKVVRRAASVMLALLLVLNMILALFHKVFILVAVMQCIAGAAFVWRLTHRGSRTATLKSGLRDKVFYFALGNMGTFLGVMDYVAGRHTPVKWTPQRSSHTQ